MLPCVCTSLARPTSVAMSLKVTWFAMPANGQVIRTNVNKVNAIPLLTIIAPFTRNTLIVACYIYSARSHPDREANCWPTIQYGIAFGLSIHISIARRFLIIPDGHPELG